MVSQSYERKKHLWGCFTAFCAKKWSERKECDLQKDKLHRSKIETLVVWLKCENRS